MLDLTRDCNLVSGFGSPSTLGPAAMRGLRGSGTLLYQDSNPPLNNSSYEFTTMAPRLLRSSVVRTIKAQLLEGLMHVKSAMAQ
ncbi:hypothetical protein TNCV_2640211 [Trichonephila clavipes]|nr:hypothetical protein TNCV_2640211 [Trichonephila clavipes]